MVRLLDIGVPRQVASAAVLDPVLYVPAEGDNRDHRAFFVVSIGRLAPKLPRFYAADAPARLETDPEVDVKAHVLTERPDDTTDEEGQDGVLFSWVTIPGHQLASRLADARRDVSAVVALDDLHERVIGFFEREQRGLSGDTA
jgi:hypothetical protein